MPPSRSMLDRCQAGDNRTVHAPADALQSKVRSDHALQSKVRSDARVVRQCVFSGRGSPGSFSPSRRLQRQTHCVITSRQRYSMDSETQRRISR